MFQSGVSLTLLSKRNLRHKGETNQYLLAAIIHLLFIIFSICISYMISFSDINDINNDNSEKHHFISVPEVDNASISLGFSKLFKFVQGEQKKNAVDFDQRLICTEIDGMIFLTIDLT